MTIRRAAAIAVGCVLVLSCSTISESQAETTGPDVSGLGRIAIEYMEKHGWEPVDVTVVRNIDTGDDIVRVSSNGAFLAGDYKAGVLGSTLMLFSGPTLAKGGIDGITVLDASGDEQDLEPASSTD